MCSPPFSVSITWIRKAKHLSRQKRFKYDKLHCASSSKILFDRRQNTGFKSCLFEKYQKFYFLAMRYTFPPSGSLDVNISKVATHATSIQRLISYLNAHTHPRTITQKAIQKKKRSLNNNVVWSILRPLRLRNNNNVFNIITS